MKPEEGLTRFLELAKTKEKPGAEEAMFQAGLCLIRLKRFEEADTLSGKLPDSMGKLISMKILAEQKKWNELAAAFGTEKISEWRDMHQKEGYHCRAEAFRIIRRNEEALADYRAALSLATASGERANLHFQCGIELTTLKRDDEALADFRKCMEFGKNYPGTFNGGALWTAKNLIRQKKYEEALAVLEKMYPAGDYWKRVILETQADVLKKMGRTAEAETKSAEAKNRKGKQK